MSRFTKEEIALNAICPYFTMFPLDFPLGVLARHAQPGDSVLDPFCGRGTTNFAARLLGLYSVGVDASPVAAAITASKFVNVSPELILEEAKSILLRKAPERPRGDFWKWAYSRNVLKELCTLRAALIEDCTSSTRLALRGVVMGALHGPRQKSFPSYFSNQCPRTYAPKPAYATRFWQARDLKPPEVNILEVVSRRAQRYYGKAMPGKGLARLADSRNAIALKPSGRKHVYNWVITSPPYYGMRTYIPDQWLRNWFLGGPSSVDYSQTHQLDHGSPTDFAENLRKVWVNSRSVCDKGARLVIRFGGIADRNANPKEIIRSSLQDTGWEITTIKSAGVATDGKRQADTFLRRKSTPLDEFVVWAR